VLEELGRALEGRRVVVVPGNHDHQLAAPVLATPLSLETVVEKGFSGPLRELAALLPGVRLAVAYPGLWIRPDVYATHGHYVDCHMTVPSAEILLASALQRARGRIPNPATPADYEAVLRPLYTVAYEVAQVAGRVPVAGAASARLWHQLKFRVGLGLFRNTFAPGPLGRALAEAMSEVVERLGIEAEHVVVGHTHSAGEWTLRGGARLVNAGSWSVAPVPSRAYAPGTLVLVDEDGPPRLRRLLD
jgi:hypothetical protein